MASCYGETKSTNDCCALEGVERLNWQNEYCFRSKYEFSPSLLDALQAGYREHNADTCDVADYCT